MIVSPPTPAPASAGITALPIPPAPATAILADLSLRCPTPPTCGSTMCRAYRVNSSSESLTGRRSSPGGTEAAGSARRFAQDLDLAKGRFDHRRRHQLSNALAAANLERVAAEVGEDDFDLPAVITVDGAGSIEAGDAVLER